MSRKDDYVASLGILRDQIQALDAKLLDPFQEFVRAGLIQQIDRAVETFEVVSEKHPDTFDFYIHLLREIGYLRKQAYHQLARTLDTSYGTAMGRIRHQAEAAAKEYLADEIERFYDGVSMVALGVRLPYRP